MLIKKGVGNKEVKVAKRGLVLQGVTAFRIGVGDHKRALLGAQGALKEAQGVTTLRAG